MLNIINKQKKQKKRDGFWINNELRQKSASEWAAYL